MKKYAAPEIEIKEYRVSEDIAKGSNWGRNWNSRWNGKKRHNDRGGNCNPPEPDPES